MTVDRSGTFDYDLKILFSLFFYLNCLCLFERYRKGSTLLLIFEMNVCFDRPQGKYNKQSFFVIQ